MNLDTVLADAVRIARDAGAVLMQYFDHPHEEATKSNSYDIVTEADKAAEAVIVQALTAAYPDHHIVGEEGGGMGAPIETAAYRWYVDPLDGTVNYASNIPIFAVSIALTDAHMQPLLGVIYAPVYDHLFTATVGGGAFRNGQPIRVSTRATLAQSMVTTGFPYHKATNADNNLRQWAAMVPKVRGERRFGAASMDFCFVAMGRCEGYWESWLNPWDCMAGILIVREAGGRVTDYNGDDSPAINTGKRIVATNGLIHDEMLRVINEA